MSVRIRRRPKLVEPCLIAAWPGVGNVALIAATYLKEKLGAKELGEIEPFGFFEPGGAFVRDNIIDTPQFPDSRLFYWKSGGNGKDLVFFLAESQPAFGGYEYVHQIIDVAQRFGVRRVYTMAASLVEQNVDNPRVLVAATTPDLVERVKELGAVPGGNLFVAGLNGLLLGVARERGLESVCLLGETAKYAAKMPNPRASHSVLKVLTGLLNVEIDMRELENFAQGTEKEIREIGDQIRSQFIQHFTTPIWEREQKEENG